MAIAHSASAGFFHSGTITSMTNSINAPGGSDTIVVCLLASRDSDLVDEVTGVTLEGNAMTQAGGAGLSQSFYAHVDIWYGFTATNGSVEVIASYGDNITTTSSMHLVVFTGVDSVSGTVQDQTYDQQQGDVAIPAHTKAAADVVVAIADANNIGDPALECVNGGTNSANQTVIYQIDKQDEAASQHTACSVYSTAATGETTTMTWNNNANHRLAARSILLVAAGGGGGPTKPHGASRIIFGEQPFGLHDIEVGT